MKKYIAYATAIGLALPVSFVLPTPAYADHLTNFCKWVLEENGGSLDIDGVTLQFDNLGECVSAANSYERDQFSRLTACKFVKARGAFEALGLENFGDCMVNFEF